MTHYTRDTATLQAVLVAIFHLLIILSPRIGISHGGFDFRKLEQGGFAFLTDAQTLSQISCHAPHADVLQSPTHLRAVLGRHSVLEPNVGGGPPMARRRYPTHENSAEGALNKKRSV